jgi:hypothetical protein
MSWQDFVFLVGSMTSVLFLFPTLRDAAAQVPRATSIPSMLIGAVYSFTFFTLGMEFSAFGSFAACTMWSLIALLRGPDGTTLREEFSLSGVRAQLRAIHRRVSRSTATTDPSQPDVDDVVQSD